MIGASNADHHSMIAKTNTTKTTKQICEGEFHTPLFFADLAHQYLRRAIPNRYEGLAEYLVKPIEGLWAHHSMYDDYNWYDGACGVANLTRDCPDAMQGGLYLSTLLAEDAEAIKESVCNPQAVVWQQDFLDGSPLAPVILERMTPGSKWIFIFNPPFAAGTSGDTAGVTKTAQRQKMHDQGLGNASKNLYLQFLHRILEITSEYQLDVTLALFSPVGWITSMYDHKMLDLWRDHFGYIGGFCFNVNEFSGVKGQWPILMSMWQTGEPIELTIADVYEKRVKIGKKQFGNDKFVWEPVQLTLTPAGVSESDESVLAALMSQMREYETNPRYCPEPMPQPAPALIIIYPPARFIPLLLPVVSR